jgi:DNA-directed RNA polymerase subunit L
MSKSKVDISYKDYSYTPAKDHKPTGSLIFELSGDDLSVRVVNAIRRVSMDNIPVYAYHPNLISIKENTTVAFNNDYMKLRLSTLPVFGVDPELSFLNEKYWKGINYNDPKREKPIGEKNIEFHVNVHNNSDSIINVTTNDAKLYVDGEIIEPYNKKFPYLLIKLRPNDTFKCDMKAIIGIGYESTHGAIWACAMNSYYDYDDSLPEKNRKYKFTICSAGQLDEFTILKRSCEYILKKLNDLEKELVKKISSKEIDEKKITILVLDGEDHTMGELLNDEFQENPDIIYSGVKRPDHLIMSMEIITEGKDGSPMKAILSSIEKIKTKFNHLETLFSDARNKYFKK